VSVVLDKVRQLEKYLTVVNEASLDKVLEAAIDKLLGRETARLVAQRDRLKNQLAEFEQKYHLDSAVFYEQFEQGKMGDEMDFAEWSATYEMLVSLEQRLAILERKEVAAA